MSTIVKTVAMLFLHKGMRLWMLYAVLLRPGEATEQIGFEPFHLPFK